MAWNHRLLVYSLKFSSSHAIIDFACLFRNCTLTWRAKHYQNADQAITCTVSMVCRRTGSPAPASRPLKNFCIWARSVLVEKRRVTELMISPMVRLLPKREKRWAQCLRKCSQARVAPWQGLVGAFWIGRFFYKKVTTLKRDVTSHHCDTVTLCCYKRNLKNGCVMSYLWY